MGRISEDLIRKRAEHNEFMLSTLEEVALHQQNIEKIDTIGQLCPHLRILYLQNNLISKIQNLHKLKELQYLNLAVNNITKVQNLQRCESLQKLDLTINFIPKAGLLSLSSLASNYNLQELFLIGNPCTDWSGYRQFVVAILPQLQKLDGQLIRASERIAALQVLPQLQEQLLSELSSEGVDLSAAAGVEDDSLSLEEGQEVAETGYVDEQGQLRRPWCPQTRVLEHREMEQANREADAGRSAALKDPFAPPPPPPRLEEFPPLPDDGSVLQKNEGKWDFKLDESDDGSTLVLDVAVGKFVDTSLIKADVQPKVVRLLIKGRLLQLLLPAEVKPDSSTAQRSTASGHLLLTMPKEQPHQPLLDATNARPTGTQAYRAGKQLPAAVVSAAGKLKQQARQQAQGLQTAGRQSGYFTQTDFVLREIRKAAVTVAAADIDDDFDLPSF
eukprot:gene2455-2758_t